MHSISSIYFVYIQNLLYILYVKSICPRVSHYILMSVRCTACTSPSIDALNSYFLSFLHRIASALFSAVSIYLPFCRSFIVNTAKMYSRQRWAHLPVLQLGSHLGHQLAVVQRSGLVLGYVRSAAILGA